MAAKLLHSLADDTPDFQRQVGCMTGILQLFDRSNPITDRQLCQGMHRSGDSSFDNGNPGRESPSVYCRRTAHEIDSNKHLNEMQRVSTESSSASFSSSSSSSLTSFVDNKASQPEASSLDRTGFAKTPAMDTIITQPSASLQVGRQSPDLRKVVKDSMYKDSRHLSVKCTTKEEAMSYAVKEKDSSRPQLCKSSKGSYRCGSKGKQTGPADFHESVGVLAELKDASWHYNGTPNCQRLSCGERVFWQTVPKDDYLFHDDRRETKRMSFESLDAVKSTLQLKELRRLSLDSRAISMCDLKLNYLSIALPNHRYSTEKASAAMPSFETQKRPPGVVAKLMGLEALPYSSSVSCNQSVLVKGFSIEQGDSCSKLSKANAQSKPVSPRLKNRDLLMNPQLKNRDSLMNSLSKLPIEPAQWKHWEEVQMSQKQAPKPAKISVKSEQTYNEIDERFKELYLRQSGKEVRALKQILDEVQNKSFLTTKKDERRSSFENQRDYQPKSTSSKQKLMMSSKQKQQTPQVNVSSTIVVMKPSKLLQQSSIPASTVASVSGFSVHKTLTNRYADDKKASVNNRAARDRSPRNGLGDSAVNSRDRKTAIRRTRSIQSRTNSQRIPGESSASSIKNSGSISPRLQQKRLELDKPSTSPTPPSDSTKPRRQANNQPMQLSSLGRKSRPKLHQSPPSDGQSSQINNDSRILSNQGEDASPRFDSIVVRELKKDVNQQLIGINDNQSRSTKAENHMLSASSQKIPFLRSEADGMLTEVNVVTPEHPSPVSVLDSLSYLDDAVSPVKHIPESTKGINDEDFIKVETQDQSNSEDNYALSAAAPSSLSSATNQEELQNVHNLVQKLQCLNAAHDQTGIDYISSLHKNANPDHRYIAEILLASGLQRRDLTSGLATFHLHTSGHPINPELFFVLEQTKASNLLLPIENFTAKSSIEKPSPEKLQRKLIFDVVNEILIQKLFMKSKHTNKTICTQKLVKELCSEFEHLQVKKYFDSSLDEEKDGLDIILADGMMNRSNRWMDFDSKIPGIVLDIERMIFKDLVNEIVNGNAARTSLQRKQERLHV